MTMNKLDKSKQWFLSTMYLDWKENDGTKEGLLKVIA